MMTWEHVGVEVLRDRTLKSPGMITMPVKNASTLDLLATTPRSSAG